MRCLPSDPRSLADLVSVGPATLDDFHTLGITTVAKLAQSNPENLYKNLNSLRKQEQDICCLDVFRCAVAQARNPRLPQEQRNWWWWSRQRKGME